MDGWYQKISTLQDHIFRHLEIIEQFLEISGGLKSPEQFLIDRQRIGDDGFDEIELTIKKTSIVNNGDIFDSDIHEAVTQISAPNDELIGKIIDVIEKGYKLGDKVIRFPKVVIGK